jgi:restriction system protein
MDRNEVYTAFELLLEEIEYVANQLNEAGASAFRSGDYHKARTAIEEATRLADFRDRVKSLQKEWASLSSSHRTHRPRRPITASARLGRGLRTPEDFYRRPILEALVELGGSATVSEVLAKVEQKVRNILNEYDLQPLPSNRRSIRWKNAARWCRNTLVQEGLIKRDSPHGMWEISDAGRQWLRSKEP